MRIKKIGIVLLLLSNLLLVGCWDKNEIDRKSFISTIAIDVGKDIGKEEEFKQIEESEEFQGKNLEKLSITFGFPDISEITAGESGTATEKFINTKAYSIQDGMTKMASKTSRGIHTAHTKLLILSDELLNYPETFKEVLDFMERDACMNKKMQVVVASGKAESYVDYKPLTEKNIESYIIGLMDNSKKNSTILPVTLNELQMLLHQNGNAIIPTMNYDKNQDQVFLSGITLLKDFKSIGNLDGIETSSLEILRGKVKGGNKVIFVDGHPVDFEIDSVKRKIDIVEMNEDNLKVKIKINLEGQLKNYLYEKDASNNIELMEVETFFEQSIEKECEKVARIMQEKYKIDAIGIREVVEKYHPSYWKTIEDNWEEVFEQSTIDVEINTAIRRIGVVR